MPDVMSNNRSLRWARVRAVITGIAFFFPGFLFSLPVTCTWANHHWAGEAQASLGAIGPSFVIGVLAAIVCTIRLLRKVNRMATERNANYDQYPPYNVGQLLGINRLLANNGVLVPN